MASFPIAAAPQMGQRQVDLAPEAVPAAERQDGIGNILGEEPVEAANLEEGRDVAIVALPAVGDLPTLHVSLIEELTAWRIDIPNHVTRSNIYTSLTQRLTALSANAESWPADEHQAARLVAHHVVAALYDLPMQEGQQQRQQGLQQQPAAEPLQQGVRQDREELPEVER